MDYCYHDIIQQFDSLNEGAVLNIMDSYAYLPNTYKKSLLDDIKSMIS